MKTAWRIVCNFWNLYLSIFCILFVLPVHYAFWKIKHPELGVEQYLGGQVGKWSDKSCSGCNWCVYDQGMRLRCGHPNTKRAGDAMPFTATERAYGNCGPKSKHWEGK